MDTLNFKQLLASPSCDCFRTHPQLQRTMLLTLGGSLAYGTNISTNTHTSDIDLRGVFAHTPKELLLMQCIDKPVERNEDNLDLVVYPLKQIFKLFSDCNPNAIELLGTKEDHLLFCNAQGKLLRDNSHLFLSQIAFIKFGGYATQQLRRLQNALCRQETNAPQKQERILMNLNHLITTFNARYHKLPNNQSLNVYLKDVHGQEGDMEICIDCQLTDYPLSSLKGMLSEMSEMVRNFNSLNHRNNKKDEAHLLKHAMHLIRLLRMGTEILEGKGINTYREHDRELLLDIRKGKYSYQEIFEMADALEKELQYAREHSPLPETPNVALLDELLYGISSHTLKNTIN